MKNLLLGIIAINLTIISINMTLKSIEPAHAQSGLQKVVICDPNYNTMKKGCVRVVGGRLRTTDY